MRLARHWPLAPPSKGSSASPGAGESSDLGFIVQVGVLSAGFYAVLIWVESQFSDAERRNLQGLASHFNGLARFFDVGVYVVASLGLVVAYVGVLLRLRSRKPSSAVVRALLVAPILVLCCLAFVRPHLSVDVFSYVAHGEIASAGKNPYAVSASSVASTPFGSRLESLGWDPGAGVSPYGPLWTQIERLSWGLTHNVLWAVRLLKLVALVATVVSGALIWLILRAVRPELAVFGAVAYLWNPVVIVQGPWEGHNDSLMVVMVLAAIWLFVRRETALAAALLTLGILVKYVPALCLPALGVAAWRSGLNQFRGYVFGILVGIAVGVAAVWPLWAGAQTFAGVRHSTVAGLVGSTPTAILWLTSRVAPHGIARIATTIIVWSAFLAYAGRQTVRARGGMTILSVTAYIVLVYYLVVSADYWPWYMLLPIALLALNSEDPRALALLVGVTVSALLVAPLDDLAHSSSGLTVGDQTFATVVIGVSIPLIILAVTSATRPRSRTLTPAPDL